MPPFTIARPKATFAFKHVQERPLLLDVYAAEGTAGGPRPAILHFHGGGLISGDRTFVPPWLVAAALHRDWLVISADFRCLPESTGAELAEDLRDAYDWLARGGGGASKDLPDRPIDPARIAVVGGSGGGYCALLGGAELFRDPAPVAIFMLYPLSDPAWPTYLAGPGFERRGVMGHAVEDAAPTLAEIEERIARGECSFGEAFQPKADMSRHGRWPYMRFVLQEGLVADYLTGVRGMAAKIREEGVEKAVPEHLRHLFPAEFGVHKELSPLIIWHGTADAVIDIAQSEKLVAKCKEVEAVVHFFAVEGAQHGFDFAYVDVEGSKDKKPGESELEKCIQALEQYM
ncbi:alpha/beta-hydrolase [Punctularia strigosozonata HHB-11173 SS5]|uniref:alpha/beta-hydrolase n=1 Tax=Punctularia strigosozonata (strain HHB-11173) TaxID=741275 RepID=UPI0004416D01|nr:alpha/beta-hydrolase [Punctularia strigosozonata HHB-11173 SS5]EIN11434.1 alpha/beta-hydrolase [Punctularia strigosozonata HHB-11173 SS5]